MVDVGRLKASWHLVAAYGDQVPSRFYSRLFVAHPEIRDLFPLSMAAQRDRLVAALGHTVSRVDELEALTPFLAQLGRDHRKFAVVADHYGPVGEALLATLADFLGEGWTPQLAEDWATAYQLVATTMIEAADDAAGQSPPWWNAEIVAHERRTFDIAVLTVRPEPVYDYAAGQSVSVETELRPRVWRYYSPANAPRPDGTIELHVRRVPGGQVSGALVDSVRVGDTLRLGSPVGQRLTYAASAGDRDIVMIAGGTGLAPLKALVGQVADLTRGDPGGKAPDVTLFVGAHSSRELYDSDALSALDRLHPWLTVVASVADPDDTLHPHASGPVVDVALGLGQWNGHEIFLCGSDEMVAASARQLIQAGCPGEQIHCEGFQGLGGQDYGVINLQEHDSR